MDVFLYAYYTLVKKKKIKSKLWNSHSTLTSCLIFSSLILEFHAGKMGVKVVSTSWIYRQD